MIFWLQVHYTWENKYINLFLFLNVGKTYDMAHFLSTLFLKWNIQEHHSN